MSRQTGLWLALCGIALGAAAAIYLRLHTAPPEAPGLPPPTSIEATTPSERQEPSRYVDARLGFSLTAPPGWINETSGVLRKQFTGARGVLVKTGTDNAVYVRVGALDLGGQRPDPQQFLTATKQALATGGALKLREAQVVTVAGRPAASIVAETKGVQATNTVRHVWVFGDRTQVYLTCVDATGHYADNAPAFSKILNSLQWQSAAK